MTLTLSITLPITLVGDGYSCGGVTHRRTTLKYTRKNENTITQIPSKNVLPSEKNDYPPMKNVKTLLNSIVF